MLTIATDDALQLLAAGWTVRRVECSQRFKGDAIEWRDPNGCSGWDYHAEWLDKPPPEVVRIGRERGDIIDRPRVWGGPHD